MGESVLANEIGQRIGRIGDNQHYRVRCGFKELRKNLLIDGGILIEQLEAAGRIVTIRCASGFLIHACGNHHQGGTCQIGVLTVIEVRGRG
jgi:hypothetical protein